jgi:hypothetical protein
MEACAATRNRGRCSTLNTSYRDRSPGRSRHLGAGVSSYSGRSTALAFPALAHATEGELLALAAADQEADGESRHRGNADCIPRLITHVTVTRLERFFGLALHLIRTV